jgi:ribosomal protein S18 acetylase RimI-like enzyme
MAAALETLTPRIVDLKELQPSDLAAVLEEETAAWSRDLDWDFRASSDLVLRFVNMQALTGFALVSGRETVGYSYYVCEERKGLIGDLYVAGRFRTVENENLLLGSVVDALISMPAVRRIESQLMMLGQSANRTMPRAQRLQAFPRVFMQAPIEHARDLPAVTPKHRTVFEAWSERRQEDAARVIALAYEGHIDSQINDQYRSVSGARRFLLNIVQYPGCGSFFQPASIVAVDLASGQMCGICLSSLVREDVGHITQICVTPDVQGTGLGYELLRRSMVALSQAGCRSVSLTVTSANDTAIALYRRVGFDERRRFAAHVWEGF